MPAKLDGVKPPFIPIGGLEGISSRKPLVPGEHGGEFKKLLLEKMEQEQGIKFSAHAKTRIESRNIDMSPEKMAKLADAVNKAEQKGARESLIVINDAAFVVNVGNRTVITAMDEAKLKENVFTNIDSAVILND
ncbi:MAG: TIGR02530 family flagellar biosynthesis protein [Calditrichia bacterium]